MRIVSIVGARPQFIKASSISKEILKQQENSKEIKEIIVHTGQHYDSNMSNIFFREMQIPKPDYFLNIGNRGHAAMTGQMIEAIGETLEKEKPNWIIVYGDTNSTLAGAIAASKLNIKIAHIEAGLRSFNMQMPEETNRILTDRISNMLFCPTKAALANLYREGVSNWNKDVKVKLTGDIMYDSILFYEKLAKPVRTIKPGFILCTVHRAENTDNYTNLDNIMSALDEIALDKQVVLVLHPRTKAFLQKQKKTYGKIKFINPVGYLEMIWLIQNSCLVITDSGGLQKEAFFLKKYCITTRNETEWVELVETGANFLAGTDKEKILEKYSNFLNINLSKKFPGKYLFGDGKASEKIITELLDAS